MLTSIRIQNFRSIRDAQVKLGQVNLFIGPNNSGKSNFLKGIKFLSGIVKDFPKSAEITNSYFEEIIFRNTTKYNTYAKNYKISFDFEYILKERKKTDFIKLEIRNIAEFPEPAKIQPIYIGLQDGRIDDLIIYSVTGELSDTLIYRPDPAKFQTGVPIINEISVISDASNLVAFIFYLSQNHKSIFRQLELDLAKNVGDLVSISTPADPEQPGKLKLKFFDKNDIGYWVEEVSEGVLYFLALLCIIHQPNPPKVILLEEPEKGIHPRRIHEVIDFIFELARQKSIQIVITSHSPYVVDYFKDIPNNISVFDRENGETVIRNAGALIEENNARLESLGEEPIHYTDALGEYWVSGFLGGVPA